MKVVPIRPGVRVMDEPTDYRHSKFFAVGRDSFIKACDLGINPATAFIVQACGTGADQITTGWSAQAVQKYGGLRWRKADEAIKTLISHRLEKRTNKEDTGTKRRYEMKCKGDLIWLPRSLVEGADDETPPVKRIRQTQDVMALRLFIESYSAHDLREDGGLPANMVRGAYERERYGEQGQYVVWGFDKKHDLVTLAHPVAAPHIEGRDCDAFWERLRTLSSLGLVEYVPYVYEGEDGEPIHAIDNYEIDDDMRRAAHSKLSDGQVDGECFEYLVPIERHFKAVTVRGIYRLRYRPWTTATRAWFADYADNQRAYIRKYKSMAEQQFIGLAV